MKRKYVYILQYEDIERGLFRPLSSELEIKEKFGVFKTMTAPPGRTAFACALMKCIEPQTGLVFPLLSMTDLDKGGMSLTNGMEDALNHLQRLLNIDLLAVSIIYRDSSGQWDGVRIKSFDHDGSSFMQITRVEFMTFNNRKLTETQAADEMIERNREDGYTAPLVMK